MPPHSVCLLRPRVEVVDGCDLFTEGSYDEAFKGCSAVFHVAAVLGNSADGNSQPNATGNVTDDVYSGGLGGTRNVISSVEKSGSVKRVVYTSSMAAVSGGQQVAKGHEWTEEDWSNDGVDEKAWNAPANSYPKSKVDTEKFLNERADASGGAWDVVAMNPAMITGPMLFEAQNGQWIEQVCRIAAGLDPLHKPEAGQNALDQFYNFIDVRDLVKGHRLAAESSVDHKASLGGNRYLMHGGRSADGRSAFKLSTDVREILHELFPAFKLGSACSSSTA